jgi:hypothetical protein
MSEVNCVVCGVSPAYIGLLGNKCECSNPTCQCYSPDLYPVDPAAEIIQGEARSNKVTTLTDSDIEPKQKPIWIWSTRHNDFGD